MTPVFLSFCFDQRNLFLRCWIMDAKTKSILIGVACSFAAVMIIILLFFSISGLSGGGSGNKGKSSRKDYTQVVSVDSDGNKVIIIEDEDDEEDDDGNASGAESSSVSSEESPQETLSVFGRSDIDGITKGVDSFAQYVKAVSPVSYEWNTDMIKATGEVEVKLISGDGSYAVIGVPYETSDYTVDGEIIGSGKDVTEWQVYDKCKKSVCRAKEIVWFSNKMGFKLPRGVKIGTDYPDISAAYYKTPNPDKTYILYDVKDVLTDSRKMKLYNKAKEAYIGGKIYKTTTMLQYNYKDNPDAYPFANNSKNIIRYGYNSVVDTDEVTGQWYIDYATANSRVVGVYYHMKGEND